MNDKNTKKKSKNMEDEKDIIKDEDEQVEKTDDAQKVLKINEDEK